ncbi:HNH endonuclease signature motif containing protein [Fimbriiglobus ruber]|uniref:HNH endonuclease signature motif containing protein n=1 Tax=Fimbriiglobus ruber TaxID=1908690 RepID=UPI000B4B47B4|nr:HNH endonuclease signature motif containing protein [Fimbriiglobus ruber]
MTSNLVTYETASTLLSYEPETGLVRRRKTGKVAGTLTDNGYIRIVIQGKEHKAHRLAWLLMTGKWPIQVDHINGARADNRWINLRETTQAENTRNCKLYKSSKSGVPGVHWNKAKKRWQVYISDRGAMLHLGFFAEFDAAVATRKQAERALNYHENHGRSDTIGVSA